MFRGLSSYNYNRFLNTADDYIIPKVRSRVNPDAQISQNSLLNATLIQQNFLFPASPFPAAFSSSSNPFISSSSSVNNCDPASLSAPSNKLPVDTLRQQDFMFFDLISPKYPQNLNHFSLAASPVIALSLSNQNHQMQKNDEKAIVSSASNPFQLSSAGSVNIWASSTSVPSRPKKRARAPIKDTAWKNRKDVLTDSLYEILESGSSRKLDLQKELKPFIFRMETAESAQAMEQIIIDMNDAFSQIDSTLRATLGKYNLENSFAVQVLKIQDFNPKLIY